MSDLDRIITFIENWTGISDKPSNPRAISDGIPKAIKTLDDKLGAFWDVLPFPFSPTELDHNTERGLFKVQDMIEDPRVEKPNSQDFTALISENQGVWHFYYDDRHNLFYEGDWIWGELDSSYSPIPFPAKLEDALCFTLMVNFFFYMDNGTWDDTSTNPEDIWPNDLTVKLWHHPSWGYFKGFWTNSDGNALLFDGMGLIRK